MKFTIQKQVKADVLVLPLFEGEKEFEYAIEQKDINLFLKELIRQKRITGEAGSSFFIYPQSFTAQAILVMGFGKKKSFSLETIRKNSAKICKLLEEKSFSYTTVVCPIVKKKEVESVRALVDGFILGHYRFEQYLSEKNQKKLHFHFLKKI